MPLDNKLMSDQSANIGARQEFPLFDKVALQHVNMANWVSGLQPRTSGLRAFAPAECSGGMQALIVEDVGSVEWQLPFDVTKAFH